MPTRRSLVLELDAPGQGVEGVHRQPAGDAERPEPSPAGGVAVFQIIRWGAGWLARVEPFGVPRQPPREELLHPGSRPLNGLQELAGGMLLHHYHQRTLAGGATLDL